MVQSYSVYIHIPFCRHRCSYCDFNTYAGIEFLIPDYVQSLCHEIRYVCSTVGERLQVHTIYFGGGTPSLLPPGELEKIFTCLHQQFLILEGVEISLEANPGTLSLSYMRDIKSMGVNRISLGMQSAQLQDLRLLERQHDYSDVVQSVRWARLSGFENINLDLIFGIPYQSMESWRRTLELALSLHPAHFSLYALTLEQDTPLGNWVRRGLVSPVDDDLAADMYEFSSEALDRAGFVHYEISNWAGRDRLGSTWACRHNLQYWRSLPYLGFGAGAHGYANQTRTANVLSPVAYIHCLQELRTDHLMPFPTSPATGEVIPLDRQRVIGEYMLMGLRLVEEGVIEEDFQDRFGSSLQSEFGTVIEKLEKKGLVQWDRAKGTLRLTKRGCLLGNQAFSEFV